jgi:hypothetical protein
VSGAFPAPRLPAGAAISPAASGAAIPEPPLARVGAGTQEPTVVLAIRWAGRAELLRVDAAGQVSVRDAVALAALHAEVCGAETPGGAAESGSRTRLGHAIDRVATSRARTRDFVGPTIHGLEVRNPSARPFHTAPPPDQWVGPSSASPLTDAMAGLELASRAVVHAARWVRQVGAARLGAGSPAAAVAAAIRQAAAARPGGPDVELCVRIDRLLDRLAGHGRAGDEAELATLLARWRLQSSGNADELCDDLERVLASGRAGSPVGSAGSAAPMDPLVIGAMIVHPSADRRIRTAGDRSAI